MKILDVIYWIYEVLLIVIAIYEKDYGLVFFALLCAAPFVVDHVLKNKKNYYNRIIIPLSKFWHKIMHWISNNN